MSTAGCSPQDWRIQLLNPAFLLVPMSLPEREGQFRFDASSGGIEKDFELAHGIRTPDLCGWGH